MRSDREAIFYRCSLSATDPQFPKYPRLPVLNCPGYEAGEKTMREDLVGPVGFEPTTNGL